MILKRFSDSKTKTEKKDSKKTRNSVILGTGLIGSELAIMDPLNRKLNKKIEEDISTSAKKDKESKKLYRKLKNKFKKFDKDLILEEGKSKLEGGNIIREDSSGVIDGSKKKIVQISGKTKGDASILSHELGHLHYLTNPKADKVGKIAHKMRPISDNSHLISFGAGFAGGARSAKKESEDKKEGALNRASGIIASTSSNLPRLISEGKASKYGYKLLKDSGASKRLLKNAKGNYKRALMTYGTGIVTDAGISELGRASGRAYYKLLDDDYNENSEK